MAALVADLPPTHTTIVPQSKTSQNDRLTQTDTPNGWTEREPEFPRIVPSRRGRTVSEIDRGERGDQFEAERNIGEFYREANNLEITEFASTDGESLRVRSETARDIRKRVNDLVPLLGDISFATNLQLLKRDLSRCHHSLYGHASETNFLSIITLIESSLSQLKLKEYTPRHLECILAAVDVGYRQTLVNFSDYDRIRKEFAAAGIDAHPRIDLDSLSENDLTDGEEEA